MALGRGDRETKDLVVGERQVMVVGAQECVEQDNGSALVAIAKRMIGDHRPEQRCGLTGKVGALVGGEVAWPRERRLKLVVLQDSVARLLERRLRGSRVSRKIGVAVRILDGQPLPPVVVG